MVNNGVEVHIPEGYNFVLTFPQNMRESVLLIMKVETKRLYLYWNLGIILLVAKGATEPLHFTQSTQHYLPPARVRREMFKEKTYEEIHTYTG